MSSLILHYIEQLCGVPIVQLFDLITGASTGAIITGLLVTPSKENPRVQRYNTSDLVNVYKQDIPRLLTGSYFRNLRSFYGLYDNRFSISLRNQYLDRYLEDLTLKDTLVPILIPSSNVQTYRPHIFKTRHARADESKNLRLTDVIIAATSAPLMYYPHKIGTDLYSDCLSLQNPVMVAVTEAIKHGTPPQDIIVLSLGTGYIEKNTPVSSYGLSYAINSVWISLNSQKQSAHYYVKHLLDPEKYLRLDFPCPEANIGTYDIRKENLAFLENAARKTFIENATQIGSFIDKLGNSVASENFHKGIDMWIAVNTPLPACSQTNKEAI